VFLTSVLTKTGIVEDVARLFKKPFDRLFGVCPLGAYVTFSSLVCGYPVGAMTLSNLYEGGLVTQKDVKAILPISSTVGPIFVIGTVGGLIGEEIVAITVLVSHYLATLLNGVLWKWLNNIDRTRVRARKSKFMRPRTPFKKNTALAGIASSNCQATAVDVATYKGKTFCPATINMALPLSQGSVGLSTSIGEAISSSVASMLSVGGYILIGGLVVDTLALVPALSSLPPALTSATYGIVEMTRGVIASTLISSTTLKTSIVTLVVTWGGLSVLMQSYHFLSRCNLTFFDVILPKITQGILAFFIAEFFSNLFFNILA
jgi:hypothetical protein